MLRLKLGQAGSCGSIEERVVLGDARFGGSRINLVDLVTIIAGHLCRTDEQIAAAHTQRPVVADLLKEVADDRERHHTALAAREQVPRLILAADPRSGHDLWSHSTITTDYRITFEAPIMRHFTVELEKI